MLPAETKRRARHLSGRSSRNCLWVGRLLCRRSSSLLIRSCICCTVCFRCSFSRRTFSNLSLIFNLHCLAARLFFSRSFLYLSAGKSAGPVFGLNFLFFVLLKVAALTGTVFLAVVLHDFASVVTLFGLSVGVSILNLWSKLVCVSMYTRLILSRDTFSVRAELTFVRLLSSGGQHRCQATVL